MTLKSKLTTSIVSAALLATSFAPAAFADTIEIVNNGADSTNVVNTTDTNVTGVHQSNSTYVVNAIGVSSNTGGNTANQNTGGDTTVDTGNATSTVTTSVTGSTNTANVNNCCECNGDADIKIRGNGADSTNVVNAGSTNVTWVKQKNKTAVVNLISAKAKTGKNKSNKNTGGNVNVLTGNASSTVGTTVTGSSNTFNQTGCCEPIPLPE